MKYLAILGVAAFAIACDSPTSPNPKHVTVVLPTAANSVLLNAKFERVSFAPDLCNGGGLVLEATWHHLFGITLDATGGFHMKDHYNVQGQGSDPSTGVNYVISDAANAEFNGTVGFEYTSTEAYNVIAKGNAPNVTALVDYHITVTPNGDVTSYHDNFRLKCQ
jgi:hypothetical protein